MITASCNCIPPRNDNYSYGSADVSCLAGNISDGKFSSEVVAGAACDADIQSYRLLSCNSILYYISSFKAEIGKPSGLLAQHFNCILL